jgi:recombination associated protein RdgC
MMFKNLRLYRLANPFAHSPEGLHEHLVTAAFRPCGSLEQETLGWVPPLGRRATLLTHGAAGAILVCARKESRMLPPVVINEELADRVAAIEDGEGRQVGRKERQELKDRIVHELLPRAFTRSSHLYAMILPRSGWVVVDTMSKARAEELLSLLREALGSLPVAPPRPQSDPSAIMTAWLAGERLPGGIELGDECELKESGEEAGSIRVKRVELLSEEIRNHLDAGRRVVKLALGLDERLHFVLDEELAVKRLTFADVVLEPLQDVDGGDDLARMDAQFALLSLELEAMLPRILEWFGGEEGKASEAA